MAKKHHPDKNPGDKASEWIFKEVARAYAHLRDLHDLHSPMGERPGHGCGPDARGGSDRSQRGARAQRERGHRERAGRTRWKKEQAGSRERQQRHTTDAGADRERTEQATADPTAPHPRAGSPWSILVSAALVALVLVALAGDSLRQSPTEWASDLERTEPRVPSSRISTHRQGLWPPDGGSGPRSASFPSSVQAGADILPGAATLPSTARSEPDTPFREEPPPPRSTVTASPVTVSGGRSRAPARRIDSSSAPRSRFTARDLNTPVIGSLEAVRATPSEPSARTPERTSPSLRSRSRSSTRPVGTPVVTGSCRPSTVRVGGTTVVGWRRPSTVRVGNTTLVGWRKAGSAAAADPSVPTGPCIEDDVVPIRGTLSRVGPRRPVSPSTLRQLFAAGASVCVLGYGTKAAASVRHVARVISDNPLFRLALTCAEGPDVQLALIDGGSRANPMVIPFLDSSMIHPLEAGSLVLAARAVGFQEAIWHTQGQVHWAPRGAAIALAKNFTQWARNWVRPAVYSAPVSAADTVSSGSPSASAARRAAVRAQEAARRLHGLSQSPPPEIREVADTASSGSPSTSAARRAAARAQEAARRLHGLSEPPPAEIWEVVPVPQTEAARRAAQRAQEGAKRPAEPDGR